MFFTFRFPQSVRNGEAIFLRRQISRRGASHVLRLVASACVRLLTHASWSSRKKERASCRCTSRRSISTDQLAVRTSPGFPSWYVLSLLDQLVTVSIRSVLSQRCALTDHSSAFPPRQSFQPTQIFEEGTTEEKGENARLSAFVGAIAVGDLVKSTLGPKGMDKILQSAYVVDRICRHMRCPSPAPFRPR